MSADQDRAPLTVTALTVLIGALGAASAYALSLPAWILLGPALLVSLAALGGLRLAIADPVRDACFVILGLAIGAGFDPAASGAMLRWPMAFVVLAVMLVVTMVICRAILLRGFGFDARSAALAAAPGHLSFVLGMAADLRMNVGRIAVVQSIRLLFLTLSVPFIAQALGYDFSSISLSDSPPMRLPVLVGLALASLLVGALFRKLRLPAPLLMAAMAVSALGHIGDWTPGSVPNVLQWPALMILGTLIGTRFSGMSRAQFTASLMAGISTTFVSVAVASLAAIPVAMALGMPAAHVLAAFSPGGLETMVALGATMGASPGFVAACHVARLLILVVLIPLFVGRARSDVAPS
ncbi:AbrB family transcriptional regulator [Sedimentitalea arenosa]|jgi:membrane AbrB-like protein|uniref:AbrB family transcriptional regulator n=1 Tax=Sedimentitalea arenosa TaxID=2798803 RepID=A0A8J7IM64_9RHOB|nr:AbrB family transcriptional regulator [Arenibacterium arenosum]MBJ6373218.1 AbrB family transcriptional regulator [Arenibacterium arenosum]